MKNCTISISLRDKSFVSNFLVNEKTPEYLIADEAYRLALRFAETQAIAIYGCYYKFHQFVDLMNDLDYDYTIE